VTLPPIAPQLHQPVDVHRNFATQITLNGVPPLDDLSKVRDITFRKLLRTESRRDIRLHDDFLRPSSSNPENVSKRNFKTLISG
jgi:hypothetical protein